VFNIKFKTDNAAFRDGGFSYEINQILTNIITKVEDGLKTGECMDTNGNIVGEWRLTGVK